MKTGKQKVGAAPTSPKWKKNAPTIIGKGGREIRKKGQRASPFGKEKKKNLTLLWSRKGDRAHMP